MTAGATPHQEDIWAAYYRSLTAGAGGVASLADLRRAGDAADLWSRALYWPAYMQTSSPEELARMLGQIQILAERLGLA